MSDNDNSRPLTVGEWFVTLLVLAIPLVNIIMLFVWAFSGSGNIGRRNFCRAGLIWALIWIVLWTLFVVAFGGLAFLAGMAGANSGY